MQRSVLAFVFALGLVGCTTDVVPPVPGDEAFTLWGQLDPTRDLQALRIAEIVPTIDQREDLDVTVVSVDLSTGAETLWRDSVLTLSAGGPAHVFVADYQPDHGSTVEVQVRRQGVVETSARATVPPVSDPAFGGLQTSPRRYVDLIAPDAPTLVGGFVTYEVYDLSFPDDGFVQRLRIRDNLIGPVEGGTAARIDLTDHIEFIRVTLESRYPEKYGRSVRPFTFALCSAHVDIAVANSEWVTPLSLPFSRELLLQPGTVSNVRGGFGFVGAAYALEREWELTPKVIQRLLLAEGDPVKCDRIGTPEPTDMPSSRMPS